MSALWDELCQEKTIRRGWHLARVDMQNDFAVEPYTNETFAYFSESEIQEILRTLRSNNFRASPLTRIPLPKGNLGTRPGTVLKPEDRIILFSALSLIAEHIDKQLSDNVYSYRTKKNAKTKGGSLFHEGDAISLPFLKTKTVRKYLDPFDAWYGLWPKFDAISREAFQSKKYRYMSTSDIAAYFENIQLDILRDHTYDLLPNEQKIIDLFMSSFVLWTYNTKQGRRYNRGIPQGSNISSFFGNIFLKPIDDAFEEFLKGRDIKYFRYMDDIRIFSNSKKDARESILLLDNEIRHLHLNLQNAKTKIFDEDYGEISGNLIDKRLVQIDLVDQEIRDELKRSKAKKVEPDFDPIKKRLKKIANELPPNGSKEQRISGARKPLSNLSDRVFRRLVSKHIIIESDAIADRLILEMTRNPDHRLGLKLVQFSKSFPRKKSLQTSLIKFLNSEMNIFPYQEAQIIQAMRYQSRIENGLFDFCLNRARSPDVTFYSRMESFKLISRCKIDQKIIAAAQNVFETEDNVGVRKAAMLVLMRQRGAKNVSFVRESVFHPHDGIRKIGRLVRSAKNEDAIAGRLLDQAFKMDSLLVDYIPLLFLMAESRSTSVLKKLLSKIESTRCRTSHINMDMRERCDEVFKIADSNLGTLAP